MQSADHMEIENLIWLLESVTRKTVPVLLHVVVIYYIYKNTFHDFWAFALDFLKKLFNIWKILHYNQRCPKRMDKLLFVKKWFQNRTQPKTTKSCFCFISVCVQIKETRCWQSQASSFPLLTVVMVSYANYVLTPAAYLTQSWHWCPSFHLYLGNKANEQNSQKTLFL